MHIKEAQYPRAVTASLEIPGNDKCPGKKSIKQRGDIGMNMCYLRKGKTLIVFLKCDTVKSVIYGSPLGATTHIYI